MTQDLEPIVRTAAVATLATSAATAIAGAIENGSPAPAFNAMSHIVWGEKAARQDGVSATYTGLGAAIHAAAMLSWAAFHHVVFKPDRRQESPLQALATGAATAAVAYFVDYRVVPKRLTPGFEKRLSNPSLCFIYAALALSLAVGAGSNKAAR